MHTTHRPGHGAVAPIDPHAVTDEHHGPAAAHGGGSMRRLKQLLLLLCVAQLMVILDISAVNVALPDMAKSLNIAGGESCRMTYYDFVNALMGAMGIGPLPIDAFVRQRPARYFGDWADTAESQELLQYQQRGLDSQLEDMRKDFGAKRHLVRLVRPLATWFVVRSSAYLKENRRRQP